MREALRADQAADGREQEPADYYAIVRKQEGTGERRDDQSGRDHGEPRYRRRPCVAYELPGNPKHDDNVNPIGDSKRLRDSDQAGNVLKQEEKPRLHDGEEGLDDPSPTCGAIRHQDKSHRPA